MLKTPRHTITSVVCGCLEKDWHVTVEDVRKEVLKDFPHSQFNKYHLPWYRNAILRGRISFDEKYIPKELRNKKPINKKTSIDGKQQKKVASKKVDAKTPVTTPSTK